ncbi:MAG: hypothetical protein ACRDPY_31855 [Streptosporangiaceae bacterium]
MRQTTVAALGRDHGRERGPGRLVLMTVCIGLFVISWAVVDRYSQTAAIAISAVALVIPPFAVIIANVASASDRRRP